MMRMPAFAMVVLGVISSITSHSWSFGEYLPTTTMYESCSWFTGGEKEALRCLFSHLSPTFCGNLAISPPRGSLKMSFQTSRERWPLLFPYKRLYFWGKNHRCSPPHRLNDLTDRLVVETGSLELDPLTPFWFPSGLHGGAYLGTSFERISETQGLPLWVTGRLGPQETPIANGVGHITPIKSYKWPYTWI